MTDSNGAPTAGWYADPADATQLRWWNGGGWTTDVRPSAPPVAPVPAVVHAEPVAPPAPATIPGFSRMPGTPAPDAPVVVATSSAPAVEASARRAMPDFSAVPGYVEPTVAQTMPEQPMARGRFTAARSEPTESWTGSPQTAGAWLLALSPIITPVLLGILVLVLYLVGAQVEDPRLLGLPLIPVLLLFARADRRTLLARGYAPPAIWWVLLTPLAYLIVRALAVRRAGRRHWSPMVVYLAQVLVSAGVVAASTVLALSVTGLLGGQTPDAGTDGTTEATAPSPVESAATTQLLSQAETLITSREQADGQTWTTECTLADGAAITDAEVRLSCVATDSAGVPHHIDGVVDASQTLNYTVLD